MNWKDASVGIHNHETSTTHGEAVAVLFTIPSTTPDIGEMLFQQHAQQKSVVTMLYLKFLHQ